jgi:hypothetical protein
MVPFPGFAIFFCNRDSKEAFPSKRVRWECERKKSPSDEKLRVLITKAPGKGKQGRGLAGFGQLGSFPWNERMEGEEVFLLGNCFSWAILAGPFAC